MRSNSIGVPKRKIVLLGCERIWDQIMFQNRAPLCRTREKEYLDTSHNRFGLCRGERKTGRALVAMEKSHSNPASRHLEKPEMFSLSAHYVKVQKRLLLSGSADGQLHFWDLYTAEPLAIIQPHDGPVNSVALAGRRFLTGSNCVLILSYWIMKRYCAIQGAICSSSCPKAWRARCDVKVNDLTDGMTHGPTDAVLKEWDLVTLTCLRSLHGHKGPIRQVKTLLHHVVSCSDDGFIRLWDLTKTLEDTT
uniref:Uncharacterized protein n=1 Tax=Branchiostoma floridae TaxID=7739 RepID=C3Z3W0_BRAFL|eukprot:XP_002596862.1 hypothetical protein BRAFLDRAFT_99764 [Branchiostoma floridae]